MVVRAVHALMALLFFFSVGLQYNDPDPVPWMTIYGSAGFITALAAVFPGRYPWPVPAVIGLVALTWAATIAPDFVGLIALKNMFGAWEMKDVLVEEARECFGLTITGLWMIVLVVARFRVRALRRSELEGRPMGSSDL